MQTQETLKTLPRKTHGKEYDFVSGDIFIDTNKRNWLNFIKNNSKQFSFEERVAELILNCQTVRTNSEVLQKEETPDVDLVVDYFLENSFEEISTEQAFERMAQYKSWADRRWTVIGCFRCKGVHLIYGRLNFFRNKLIVRRSLPNLEKQDNKIYILFTQEPAS